MWGFTWHVILGSLVGFGIGIVVILLIDAKNIINHTLKNPANNQYSRKNLAGVACMAFAMLYCIYGLANDKVLQEFVVAIFVGASLTCLGISSWEKANVDRITKKINENEKQP